jgi:hypothetical protein
MANKNFDSRLIKKFNPCKIIESHFDSIFNEINYRTDEILKNRLVNPKTNQKINATRKRRLDAANEMKKNNLILFQAFRDEENFEKFNSIIDNALLNLEQKVEAIKRKIVLFDFFHLNSTNDFNIGIRACLIDDHFDTLSGRVKIHYETVLLEQNFNQEERMKITRIRDGQLEKIEQIKRINHYYFGQHFKTMKNLGIFFKIMKNASFSFEQKLERIKKILIINDCVLLEDFNSPCLNIWATAWFYNSSDLEFLK